MIGRAYLRKSRGEESNPALLREHRSIIAALATADAIPLPPEAVIEEVGSADTLADRPRFRALLEELAGIAGPVILYCMDIDRLTRGPLPDRAAVYAGLLKAGALIRTPDRLYNLANPDDELLFEMKGLFARQELAFYRRRVREVWDNMTRKGMVLTGVAPKGYRWDKNIRNFVEEPEGAALVRCLFAEAVDLSSYALARKYGGRPSSILRILTNPVYTGYPARHCRRHRFAGRQQSSGTQYLPRQEWAWPEQQGTYPALVSREQFERVQIALRARHRTGPKTTTTEGWCRDVIEFEGMPGRIDLGSHGRPGARYLTYQVKGERRLYVDRRIVHAAAETALLNVLGRPDFAAFALAAREATQTPPPSLARPEASIQAELAERRRQLDVLLEREIGTADPEEAASISRLRAEHRRRISALVRELQPPPPAPAWPLARLAEQFPDLQAFAPDRFARASETEKRTLTAAILARLLVRITPQPHPEPYLREVAEIQYHAWLKPFLS